MELKRIVWTWEIITHRLLEAEPPLGQAVARSCRPIAAQRYNDGRLLVVLGCWLTEDLSFLSTDSSRLRLGNSLGELITEKMVITVVRWPGGMVRSSVTASTEMEIPPPDVLQGLPEDAREEASKCESVIQRFFFARAYARGLRLLCQHPILHYRLDFAIPEKRIGAEVMGWDWRAGPSGIREMRERQNQLEDAGWRISLFSGSQVLADVEKCISMMTSSFKPAFDRGQKPLSSGYSPQPRKPFSSLGKPYQPKNRDPRRPHS